ncbi:response regulator [Psychrosphaera haliotis]|uniref:Sensory/regulatory protein RpfC n=1 Tax=Psychrosphaera haliotis TaxID=555083 RepID=A0A6N8F8V1_9GAMM|nr:response regulator [Psychrosphaera haliotis]MUH72976.1 response regulator [Psychrosphaera haliotis]
MLSKKPIFKPLPALCAIFVMLLGSLVMMGWAVENQSIVQLHKSFAPMQFNTALLFLLSGLSLWFLTESQLKLANIVGGIIFAVASLSTLQYVLDVNVGLDQLFVSHFIDINTTSPGRMAPNTGICFSLIGLLLLVVGPFENKRWPVNFAIILATISFATASVALAGYFNNVTTAYGWGQMTHMALHTCIGFITISTGFIVFFVQKAVSFKIKVDTTLLLFIFFTSVTLTLSQALLGHERLQLERRLAFYIEHVESEINDKLLDKSNQVLKLSEVLQSEGLNSSNQNSLVSYLQKNKSNSGSVAIFEDGRKQALTEFKVSIDTEELESLLVKGKTSDRYPIIGNSNAYIINISTLIKDSEYFAVYYKNPDVNFSLVQFVHFSSFLGDLDSRYNKLNIAIKIEDSLGNLVNRFSPIQAEEDVLSYGRVFKSSGWTVTLYSERSSLSDGSLANVILMFGIIFCGLMVGISKLLMDSKARAIEISKESEARKDALKKANEARLINEMARKVSGLGIWVWDLDKKVVSWDNNMFDSYHMDPKLIDESLLYDSWVGALHPEDAERVESSLQDAVRNKQDWYCTFRLTLENNKVKYMIASGTCISDEYGNVIKVVGGNFDVTELREAQERLVTLKEQADQNSLAKSQFLANMSHEIRTPMNGVLGITDLLSQTPLTPIQQEYLDLVVNSASSLLRILNDILDQSKIEAGMMELVEEHFSLDNKVGDILKGFAPTAHQKMIELEYNIDGHVPNCIRADETRISQMIFNVVGNAVKFTETGEVILEVVSLKPDKELEIGDPFTLIITIKDTGIGIPEDKLLSIFEPFGQVDSTTTRRFGGTGLGLPIVKQLVNLMGGNVEVSSQPSIGTEFKINLPVKKGDIAQLSNDEGHAHIINQFDFTGISCLAVDDNAINRRWLKSMIGSWGCKPIMASCSDQAIALYDAEIDAGRKVDVLIVDKDMPQKTGLDFIIELKAKYKNIPRIIMMLTSKEINDSLMKLEELDIEHYLLKPVKQSEVFNMLMKVMEVDRPDLHYSKKDELSPPEKLLNVLVAEDNPINSRLVHDILTYRGHQSTLVFNGKQALEQYKGHDYDVILMDVQMPEMDGLESTKLIRQFEQLNNKERVKIIGLTAHALSGDRQICIDAGMDNYLTKPVDSKNLILTIESYFNLKNDSEVIKLDSQKSQATDQSQATQQGNADEKLENEPLVIQERPVPLRYIYLDLDGIQRVSGGQQETIDAISEMTLKILPQEIEDVESLLGRAEFITLAKLLHRLKEWLLILQVHILKRGLFN